MKNKKVLILIIVAIIVITLLIIVTYNVYKVPVDYKEYDYFTDINWTRTTKFDTEYLRFNSDGTLSYYCACGSPINGADLCDSYQYNEKNKTIKLKCLFKPNSTITKIKIKKYDENSIELDFNGEIRKFTRANAS